MYSRLIRKILTRETMAVVLWGTAIGALLAHDLFHGAFPGALDFGILLALGLMSGAVIADFRLAIFGFLFAFAFGTILVFALGILPALTGAVPPPGDQAVYGIWIAVIFRSVFPLPFIISLISSILGVGLGETYLEDPEPSSTDPLVQYQSSS